MRVLVACEYSGRVRDAFTRQGHDATSADLLPTETPGKHHCGDVRDVLGEEWDLIVAHPPCTYLTNSGVSWLHKDPERWAMLDDGAGFFRLFMEHPCERVAIENPIPHKYAVKRLGRKYDQLVQPYMFGHLETKATCFWLKGLAPLVPTTNLKEETMSLPAKERMPLHWLPPGPDRWRLRSATYQGIADAMAAQWGVVQPAVQLRAFS